MKTLIQIVIWIFTNFQLQ